MEWCKGPLTLSSKSLRLSLPSQKCAFDRVNPSQVPNSLRVLEELTSHHPSLECFLFLLLLYPITTSWFLASRFANVLLWGAHGTKIEPGYSSPTVGQVWVGCTEPPGAAPLGGYWSRILGRAAQESAFSISPKAMDIGGALGTQPAWLWLGPISLHRLTLH